MIGIGYQEARKLRMSKGLTASQIEAYGNEEYLIYFGRAHVKDFETGVLARGPLKIGRGKYKTALQRSRNQPGIDFRIYAEILLFNNRDTHTLEAVAKRIFKDNHILGDQGQNELYNFKDADLYKIVPDLAEVGSDCHQIEIKSINFFSDNGTEEMLFKNESNFHKLFTEVG